jgi:hypothetical protein
MRDLFLVPWMSPRCRTLLSFLIAAILVFSIVGVLKTRSPGKDAPTEELLTGSIQKSRTVPKASYDDRVAAPLSTPQSTGRPVQNLTRARSIAALPTEAFLTRCYGSTAVTPNGQGRSVLNASVASDQSSKS